METIENIGKILPADHQQERDAVHIALMPVVAGQDLCAGQKLRLMWGTNVVMDGSYNDDYVGIADPFIGLDDPLDLRLHAQIKKGQFFLLWSCSC